MKKRILTVLLVVCLVFALGTVSALADDPVAKIGDTPYTDLSAAFNAVQDGETIVLQKDVELTSRLEIRKDKTGVVSFTLNLNNHKLSRNGTVLDIYNSDITIENGTIETTYTSGGTMAILCNSNVDLTIAYDAVVNALGGTNDNLNFGIGIGSSDNDEKISVTVDGTLSGGCGLTINGNIKGTENDISVNINGTIDVTGLAVYLAGYGKTTINSTASVKGDTGVEIRAGELTVNGGTIVGGGNYTSAPNSNGSTVSGAGIAVSQHTTNQEIAVTINGGNISGGVALAQEELQSENNAEQVDISVSGGNFKATDAEYEAIKTHSKKTVTVTGGKFLKSDDSKSDVGKYLAPGFDIDENGNVEISDDAIIMVDGTPYTNVYTAFNNIKENSKVTLIDNIDVDMSSVAARSGALTISADGVTFDGGDHTIKATGTNSNSSTHVLIISGDNVTVQNLIVDANNISTGSAMMAFNATGIKLNTVTLQNSKGIGLNVNSATVEAANLTTKNNSWGGVDVDPATQNKESSFTLKSGNVQTVYTDNDSNTSSTIIIEGGTVGEVYNHVDAKNTGNNTITIKDGIIGKVSDYANGSNAKISVTGGTFGESVKEYVNASNYPYEAVTAGGTYSYHATAESARNAAGQNGEVNYLRTGTTWDVTLYYDKDVQTKIEVPDDYVLTLPGGTFEGKQIEGWKYGSEVFEPGDRDTITSDRTYYVILRNGQYNIVIDNDIKHGDVSTDVSSADKGATVYIYVDPDIGYVLDDLDVYYGYRNQYSVNVKFVRTGVYSFIMPGNNVYITATFRYESLPFTDVNRSQWFYDEVYYVYTNGMMEGDSATTFNPDGRMTRAMFWAVLGRIDGATITGNDWAEEARAWAMREGVSDGTNPNDYVTREQMVTMLWRYAGEKNGSASLVRYTDADKISSYAVEAMRWAIGNCIIEGMTSTTLEPQGTATRAQCAAIFMRFDQM